MEKTAEALASGAGLRITRYPRGRAVVRETRLEKFLKYLDGYAFEKQPFDVSFNSKELTLSDIESFNSHVCHDDVKHDLGTTLTCGVGRFDLQRHQKKSTLENTQQELTSLSNSENNLSNLCAQVRDIKSAPRRRSR